MTERKTITQEYLKSRLNYDPDMGIWRWLPKPELSRHDRAWNSRRAGKIAGMSVKRYIQIRIDGTAYYAHRLAVIYMLGRDPNGDVDHINRKRHDCRWRNLREAPSRSHNMVNAGRRADNTGGHRGITWRAGHWLWIPGRWRATVQFRGKMHHLGYFKNKQDAVTAYRKRATELFGEYANFTE